MSGEQFPTGRAASTGTNHGPQRNHSRKFNIRAPILENMISVLQQLPCSWTPRSQIPMQTAERAHSHWLLSPSTAGLSN